MDIYSLGVALFCMRTVNYPFEKFDNENSTDLEYLGQFPAAHSSNFYLFNVDKNAYYQRFSSLDPSLSDEFKSFFNAMCCSDPAMRPSVADILVHPWLQNDVASPQELAEALLATDRS